MHTTTVNKITKILLLHKKCDRPAPCIEYQCYYVDNSNLNKQGVSITAYSIIHTGSSVCRLYCYSSNRQFFKPWPSTGRWKVLWPDTGHCLSYLVQWDITDLHKRCWPPHDWHWKLPTVKVSQSRCFTKGVNLVNYIWTMATCKQYIKMRGKRRNFGMIFGGLQTVNLPVTGKKTVPVIDCQGCILSLSVS